jgi:Sigma-70, region 4
VLHHLVGLPVNEVADQLRIPAGTVKTRLARGRAALVRRHHRRQAALGAVLVVAVAGVLAVPGAGLLDRRQATVVTPGPPTTAAVPALAAPTVGRGEFAAVIQDPPAGFPARIRGRVTGCGPIDMPPSPTRGWSSARCATGARGWCSTSRRSRRPGSHRSSTAFPG